MKTIGITGSIASGKTTVAHLMAGKKFPLFSADTIVSNLYKKIYFYYYSKKVMTYSMVDKTPFKFPTERYLNVVKQGYKDCDLDKKYLKSALNYNR